MSAHRRWMAVAAIISVAAATAAAWGSTGRSPDRPQRATPPTTFTNPAVKSDFPDPFVLAFGGHYYAYATNVFLTHIPTFESSDLQTWTPGPDALPRLPGWASHDDVLGLTWAPTVIATAGGFDMYYTTGNPYSGLECISIAHATAPLGPFVDTSAAPLKCQRGYGGDIDPSVFVDTNGQRYLLWKSDGNCCGKPTLLWSQRLNPAGDRPAGPPAPLMVDDQAWQDGVIEAPSMIRHASVYYLFFSGNAFYTSHYAIGYAVCASPLGPCVQPQDQPLFASSGAVAGPGGEEFFRDQDGELLMCYAAFTAGDTGVRATRSLRFDPISFHDGVPVIDGPTLGTTVLSPPP